MSQKSKIQNYFITLSALVILFSAAPVFAAELFLEAKSHEFALEGEFPASLFLNTENEGINAVEGKIVFPEKLLELKEIRDGNSIINFWIEKPKIESGQVVFSGITPGGYAGKQGLIFLAVFQARAEGEGVAEIRDVKVLLNDGKGTPTNVKISNFQFSIPNTKNPLDFSTGQVSKISDNEPPEDFRPEISQTPEIFDGKYFLVFATQDKGLGIDHYEIQEGKGPFIIAESPYLLQNQNLDGEIAVKAVDKNGNIRTAHLAAPRPRAWYKDWWIWSTIILGIIAVFVARKFK